jgi:alpha-ribazole phosphatase
MRIALVRHLPPSIAPNICYGRLDVAIDPAAEAQIKPLATNPALQGATRVLSSPARRCTSLAAAIARTLAVPLALDKRLRELDFGDWEGRSWDAIPRAELDRWAMSPLTFAPPGGEPGAALIARIRDFHAGLLREGQNCVIVSHGGPLKLLTPLLLGEPADLLAAPPPLGSVRIISCGARAIEVPASATITAASA